MKLLREPLIHFIFIGATIYVLFGLFAEPELQETDNKIVVSSSEIEVFKTSWQKRWNRPPTDNELDGVIQQYIRETVLYRQALSMGLDKNDTVIRRRLAQKMKFLVEDLATMLDPDDQTLQAWFDDNKKRFQTPPRYTFTQIFFDPDKRGDATLTDAETVKASLLANSDTLKSVSEIGDGLMLQDYYPEKTPLEIRKQFGNGFTQSLMELSAEQWHGPILSGYGVHLIYIEMIVPVTTPTLAAIRDQVKSQWLDEQRQSLNKKFYAKLVDNYDIVIEEIITETKIQDDNSQPSKDGGDKKVKNLVKDNSVASLQEGTQ